jgi:predicted kinase
MRCLALGGDVVLDCGFWRRDERDRARRLAGECGARALAVVAQRRGISGTVYLSPILTIT